MSFRWTDTGNANEATTAASIPTALPPPSTSTSTVNEKASSSKKKRKVTFNNNASTADTTTNTTAATSSNTSTTATFITDDVDDVELEIEARRAYDKLTSDKLFGIDFDQYAELGIPTSASSSRGRGVQVHRRQERIHEMLAQAQAYVDSRQFHEAFSLCMEMIKVNARAKEPYLLLSDIMERKDDPDLPHSIDYLSLAAQFHKRDLALWASIADKACTAQLFDTAILAYRMLIKYGEDRVDRASTMHQLARCYELNRDDEKAHKQILDIIKQPVASEHVIGIAQMLYKYGEVERAIDFVCRQLSALAPADTSYRNNFAAVLTQMYRENYLHQECVVFLGHLLGAPRAQYQIVVDQLAAEAREVAEREAGVDRADGPVKISLRNIPAMLPLETVKAVGLIPDDAESSSARDTVAHVQGDDDGDDEEALFGKARAPPPTAKTAPAVATAVASTRVMVNDTVLLSGNVLLGNEPPSIDLITPYACSLAECHRGLKVAEPLFRFVLSLEGEFDLHLRIARTMMEAGEFRLARVTMESIFGAVLDERPDAVTDVAARAKLTALLLQLYSMCCKQTQELELSYELHERALELFGDHEATVVRVAEEFEMHGEYDRARDVLQRLYQTVVNNNVEALLEAHTDLDPTSAERQVLEQMIVGYPKLVAMYTMMQLFCNADARVFVDTGVAILSSRNFQHAPLSDEKFDKVAAQRAHLRARQGAEVGGEVRSLIGALGPDLYADLCAQVGYFLCAGIRDHGESAADKLRAFRIAHTALSAQHIVSTVRRSRRLSRAVKFEDPAIARLAFIAVRGATSGADRAKYARMMVKHDPNSNYVWQELMGDTSLHSLLGSLTSDAEKRAMASNTPQSATPLTARGLFLLKQNQLVGATNALEEALRRRPNAPFPALLLAIAAARQASASNAPSDTMAVTMSALRRYAALRLEPATADPQNHPAEQLLLEVIRQAEVSYNFGRAMQSLGWMDQAEAFYLASIEILRDGDPTNLLIRLSAHNLALVYEQRGEQSRAAAIVEQYVVFT